MKPYNEEVLCNLHVSQVKLSQTKTHDPMLFLIGDSGIVCIEVNGDCCSDCFIDKVRFDLPATLTGDYTEVASDGLLPTSQEVDRLKAVVFAISPDGMRYNPVCGFEHRNSSNGYYGNYWRARKVESVLDDAIELVDGRYGF
jgi:hypothetical protein